MTSLDSNSAAGCSNKSNASKNLSKIETQGESLTNLWSTSQNSKTSSQKLSLMKMLSVIKLWKMQYSILRTAEPIYLS